MVGLPFTCAECRKHGTHLALTVPETIPEPGTRMPVRVTATCRSCGQQIEYGTVTADVGTP